MADQAQMSLKIRVRNAAGSSRSTLARGYRIQPTSFILSIVFHVVVVTGLLLLPHVESEDQAHDRPIYDTLIKPEEKKIIWFAPPKKKLPDISAQETNRNLPQAARPAKIGSRDDRHRAQA